MVELRDYQKDYILALRESMRKNKRLILCATTGAGKTIMFSYMTLNAFNNKKNVLIITDRIELFNQSDGTLTKFGLNPTLINSKSKKIKGTLHIAMMQTLARRLDVLKDFISELDLIIIDEAHKTIFD